MNSSAELLEYAGGFQVLKEEDLKVALPVVLGVICLVGLAGNTMVVTVLIHDFRQGKSSVVNGLIFILSATDLLILLLCVPLRAVTYSKPSWTFGWLLCKSSDYFLHACLSAKSFTLAAVGHARYKHVSSPQKSIHCRCQRVLALTCSVWSVALLLPIPHWLFSNTKRNGRETSCVLEIPTYASNFMKAFGIAYPLAAYGIPMTFAMACYIKALLLNKPRRNRTLNRRYEIRRVTMMLWGLSVAFAAMRLPDWVAWMWARHRKAGSPMPPIALLVLAQVVLFANCTVNPLVFLALSEDFKDGLRSVWPLAACRKARRSSADGRGAATTSLGQRGGSGLAMGNNSGPSLRALPTISGREDMIICRDVAQSIPPDVQHFWQDRKNAAPPENNDPIPWERQENS
ncbi:G-protein coupled receptor 151-like [Carcharodon carcharias]|uniref:G-protein coupled receptor 151-like n=1 Tax=Carcharodon carcharias TaxID=13397 RepID=UPI001B7F77F9|nr:G-protein coupled receptor 151-like [Carcharodon carcharias]